MEQVFLTNQKFKAKCILNFRKYRSTKKFRFSGVKIGKIK